LIANGKHDLPESFELSVPHSPVVSIDTDGAGKPSAAAANKFRLKVVRWILTTGQETIKT
jgi:hypothetical protein